MSLGGVDLDFGDEAGRETEDPVDVLSTPTATLAD